MIRFDSEKSFEQFLFDQFNEKKEFIVRDEYYDECYRQFSVGSYGICDLVFVRKSYINEKRDEFQIEIHVSELKNEPIKMADIAQLCRYKTFFDRATRDMKNVSVTYSLVVPYGVKNNDDCCFLINGLDESIEVWDFYLRPESGVEFDPCVSFSREKETLSLVSKIIPEDF